MLESFDYLPVEILLAIYGSLTALPQPFHSENGVLKRERKNTTDSYV